MGCVFYECAVPLRSGHPRPPPKINISQIGAGLARICLGSPSAQLRAKNNDGKTVAGGPRHARSARTHGGGRQPCLRQCFDESEPFLHSAVATGHPEHAGGRNTTIGGADDLATSAATRE